jgi:histidinol-phosphate/aromatic aminotransferase/cobyric acid decarboxylase-like protein
LPAGRSYSDRRATGPPTPVIDPESVPSVDHGGMPPGRRPTTLVDLSLSTNPYGPPPYTSLAIDRGSREVGTYPDRAQAELTGRLGESLGVDPGEVLAAGSASELLRIAIAAFGSGRRVLLSPHTYGEFERIAASIGASVDHGPLSDLRLRPEFWADRVRSRSLVVVANPGTPNGQYLSPRELAPLVASAERRRGLVLVDESYLPFVRGGRSIAGTSANILTVFSWSKMLGTPGLPLGHAVGSADLIRALRSHILPWSVGPFARHLGLLALERPEWAHRSLALVERTAREVRRRLRSPSRTNYFLVRSQSGTRLARALNQQGFRVRDLTSMGLRDYVRFAVRRRHETNAFLEALAIVSSQRGVALDRKVN